MTPIDEINLSPFSGRLFAKAANGSGWTRCTAWPADALGEYGANTSTDADLDAWVHSQTGIAPGAPVVVRAGEPPLFLSVCAGRDKRGRPAVVLRMHG